MNRETIRRSARRLALLAATALLTAAAMVAQAPAAPDAEARALLALEDGWASAMVRHDVAYFRRTLAAGFIYTEDDQLSTRAEVLQGLESGSDTVTDAHNEGMQVHRWGTTAVVTGWLIVTGHGASGPFSHRYRFTDTWLKRNGRWQIVAAQDYLVKAAQ